MKANAPEKIYLHPTAKGEVGASWLTFPLTNEDIEYIHKDAFIEKAIGWIDYNNRNGGCNFDGWEKDFKKYMED
ncbi:MAG: hypothetical protein IJV29_07115 [Butyrivibrio sp.]|nr:hypothetical protein [Butyrivibrio sp.]